MAAHLLAALSERGHTSVVLASHGNLTVPDVTEYLGIPVYRFPMFEALTRLDLRLIADIRRCIAAVYKAFQPDVMHLHLGGDASIVYFYLRTVQGSDTPTLLTLHGCLQGLSSAPATVLGQCLRAANRIVAGSHAMLDDLLYIAPDTSPRAVYMTYSVPPFSQFPAPLPREEPCLICVGRLVEDKGFDLALTAFAALIRRYPRAHLILVGDGPEREALQRQVVTLGVEAQVTLWGDVAWETVEQMINRATLVVVPSRWREPFGLVALEAANLARPVIATNVGGLSEIVVHQHTGLLVEPENPQALAEAITYILDHPEVAQAMGQAARVRATTHFNWSRYVESYEALYQTMVSCRCLT